MENVITAIIIGAGNRGKNYARYALQFPKEIQIVGVAEPKKHIIEYMKKLYSLENKRCYSTWEDVCKEDKFADCAIICTQDQDHVGPAVAMAKKGYHILLEKPMAVTPEDCHFIYKSCIEAGVKLCVGHVLRYHPSVIKMKEMIDSGIIGDVVNIAHTEPVGFWHFAHSFVRGNWRNEKSSTFSLLSKCCHDIDLIAYWMNFRKCLQISSFGSLMHFRKENKPKNASSRCMDCPVEKDCCYSAKMIYLKVQYKQPEWPMSAVCDIEDSEEGYYHHLSKAVKKGPYGKCVYDTDNDVCDNQVVNFQFENGATATLTMVAFSEDVCKRKVTIYGTKGELKWGYKGIYEVQHFDFLTAKSTVIDCKEGNQDYLMWGHGGADYHIMKTFVDALKCNKQMETGARISLDSHLLAFVAEKARLTKKVINPQEDSLLKGVFKHS